MKDDQLLQQVTEKAKVWLGEGYDAETQAAVKAMLENGEKPCDIAKFAIDYINVNLEKMTVALLEKHGSMPVLFAGGVSSNKTIRINFENKFNAYFAEPQFSCDNAAGLAVYAYLKSL